MEIVSEVDSEGALSVEMKGSNMGILIGKEGRLWMRFSILQIVLPINIRTDM